MNWPELPRETEIAIVGGGVVGLRLAWLLAERGMEVALIDDGHFSGSTVNAGSLHVQMQSRFIRLFPDLAPAVEASLPLYLEAVRAWRAVSEAVGGGIGLDVSGGLMVAETQEQLTFLAAKAAREAELGLEVEILERPALDRLAPYLGPAVIGAELCHNEGKINPLAANRMIRRAAIGAGAGCFYGLTVGGIAPAGEGWELSLGPATLAAGKVIVAAGARSGSLVEPLGIALPVRPEPLHVNITEACPPLIGHLVQHAERMITMKQLAGGNVVIGGGWPAHIADPARPPSVLHASITGNVGLGAHIVPAIAGLDIIRTWAGVNPTADGLSVLGPAPDHSGLYFAVGGDAGYTLGPFIAGLVADCVTERKPAFDLAPFSVSRFSDRNSRDAP